MVARKKGMNKFYTSADGRQQKRPPSLIPEPVRDLVRIYTVRELNINVVPSSSRSHVSNNLHIRHRELLATTTQSTDPIWRMTRFR